MGESRLGLVVGDPLECRSRSNRSRLRRVTKRVAVLHQPVAPERGLQHHQRGAVAHGDPGRVRAVTPSASAPAVEILVELARPARSARTRCGAIARLAAGWVLSKQSTPSGPSSSAIAPA